MHGCQRDRLAAGCALLIALLSLQSLPAFQAVNPEYLRRDKLTGRRGGNLAVAINSDPASFNRMLTASLAHATVTDRMSADLVHINRATADLDPALAKSWAVSPDGRGYMLQLRRGLRFSDGSPFVVEAVVENEGIKKKVLAEVEALLPEGAILASNTSTISITKLATALRRPESFCGMHFFNPVPRMPLVEVIRGEKSSPEAIATAVAYAQTLGKTPIVVGDCAGFLATRTLRHRLSGYLILGTLTAAVLSGGVWGSLALTTPPEPFPAGPTASVPASAPARHFVRESSGDTATGIIYVRPSGEGPRLAWAYLRYPLPPDHYPLPHASSHQDRRYPRSCHRRTRRPRGRHPARCRRGAHQLLARRGD